MRKMIRSALDNRNRLATAGLIATGAAMNTLASAQTAGGGLDGAAVATGAADAAQQLMGAGGPAVFGLIGVATGAIWLINRVRSLG